VPVAVQRAEWEFATTEAGLAHTCFRDDYLRPGLRIELVDRTIVLACDAADLRRNITQVRACGTTARAGGRADAYTRPLSPGALGD
jgi:hypothetical protein